MRPLAAVLLAIPTAAAASTDLAELFVPIAVVATVFGCSAVMVGIVAYTLFRVRRLRHETIRVALEKGQPLPPDLLEPPRKQHGPLRDLRTGLILLGIGVGVAAFMGLSGIPGVQRSWTIGFIPGFMGAAYLAAFTLSRRLAAKPDADHG
jgi:Domain of unknown function (DUF6249)